MANYNISVDTLISTLNPQSGDKFYPVNGAELIFDISCRAMQVILGTTSSGPASAGQKYGKVRFRAGITVTWDGAAASTGSGVQMSPSSPGAESSNCLCTIEGTQANPTIFTCASFDTSHRYSVNNVYGLVNCNWLNSLNCWEGLFYAVAADTTKAPVGGVQNFQNISFGPRGVASFPCINFTVPAGGCNIGLKYGGLILDQTGMGSAYPYAVQANASTIIRIAAGGYVESGDIKVSPSVVGIYWPVGLSVYPTTTDPTYYGNRRISMTDYRCTRVIPANLAFYDPATNGEIRFVVSNIGNFAATDILRIFDSGTGLEIGACTVSRYTARAIPGDPVYSGGYGIIPNLVNGVAVTGYAKTTSDNFTFSDASNTATGTPTDGTLLKFSDPGTANVRLGTQWKYNSDSNNRTGTAEIPSAANTRYGVSVDGTTGTCRVPGKADVRLGVPVDVSDTGLINIPPASDVRNGVLVDQTTGTMEAIPAPLAPSGIKAVGIDTASIRVYLTFVSTAKTFKIYRATAQDGTYVQIDEISGISYLDNDGGLGLDPNTEYWYKLKAHNDSGDSDYSIAVKGKTLAAPSPDNPDQGGLVVC